MFTGSGTAWTRRVTILLRVLRTTVPVGYATLLVLSGCVPSSASSFSLSLESALSLESEIRFTVNG
jgi:hypothetical protein